MAPLLILALAFAEPPGPPADPMAAAAAEVRQKVVTAIRNCPETKGEEIVVCSKDRGVAESFRLPKLDPRFAVNDPKSRDYDKLNGAGAAGAGSCSPVGAMGSLGCSKRDYEAWADWKKRQLAAKRAAEGASDDR